jgi:hypothetical protein
MYRVEFGYGTDVKRLYIFKVENNSGGFPNLLDADNPAWVDVNGDASAVNIRYDLVKANGIFTPIIKQSLELSFIRTNNTDFNDIIEAEENTYMAVITKNSTLTWRASGDAELYISGETPEILFKGLLTNATYGESYLPFPSVKFTFHDRLGELADVEYEPKTPQMRLTDILADLLKTNLCVYKLLFEFPYDIDLPLWKDLDNPRNILLDVTAYYKKKKLDVLTDILETFGLQLFCDYTPYKALFFTFPYLYSAGAIRIRQVEKFGEFTKTFHSYTIDLPNVEYDLDVAAETLARSPRELGYDLEILNRSGAWNLVRRAKYIDGFNNFVFKENIFYPNDFNIDDFDYESNPPYDLTYRYWFLELSSSFNNFIAKIKSIAANTTSDQHAYSTRVGLEKKLGVMVRDQRNHSLMYTITSPVLMIKGTNTINFSVEVWSNQATRNLYIGLAAVYGDDVYTYDEDTTAWVLYEGTAYRGLRVTGFDASVYHTAEFTGIVQPPAYVDDLDYQLLVFFSTGNTAETTNDAYTFVTDFKCYLSSDLPPSKLKVRTAIATTLRKPIEFESKFYNLPNIYGNTALYASGILAKDLDYYVGGVLDTEDVDQVIAPPTLEYEGNNGTMLVHLSDMIGSQHLYDRWEFNATVIKGVGVARYFAEWDNPICETETS